MPYMPTSPTTIVDGADWTFKEWFQSMWRYTQGSNIPAPVQTASFVPDLLTFFYPCDTSGGAITCTLPPAADCLGKVYTISHTVGAAAVTVALTGADTMLPATATSVALNQFISYISDGTSIWYATAGPSASSGGSTVIVTTITATGAFVHNLNASTKYIDVFLQGGGSSGGGGGGGGANTGGGAGGSAGEYVSYRMKAVTGGAALNGNVGAGGTSSAAAAVGKVGADTTFDAWIAKGSPAVAGAGGAAAAGASGAGGGRAGAAGVAASTAGLPAVQEVNLAIGGASGGGGTTVGVAGAGGICDGIPISTAGTTAAALRGGGGGGAGSQAAPGGNGGNGNNAGAGAPGIAGALGSGGGGGGGSNTAGNGGISGAGGNGFVTIVEYT